MAPPAHVRREVSLCWETIAAASRDILDCGRCNSNAAELVVPDAYAASGGSVFLHSFFASGFTQQRGVRRMNKENRQAIQPLLSSRTTLKSSGVTSVSAPNFKIRLPETPDCQGDLINLRTPFSHSARTPPIREARERPFSHHRSLCRIHPTSTRETRQQPGPGMPCSTRSRLSQKSQL